MEVQGCPDSRHVDIAGAYGCEPVDERQSMDQAHNRPLDGLLCSCKHVLKRLLIGTLGLWDLVLGHGKDTGNCDNGRSDEGKIRQVMTKGGDGVEGLRCRRMWTTGAKQGMGSFMSPCPAFIHAQARPSMCHWSPWQVEISQALLSSQMGLSGCQTCSIGNGAGNSAGKGATALQFSRSHTSSSTTMRQWHPTCHPATTSSTFTC
jgi:hypothetical protein